MIEMTINGFNFNIFPDEKYARCLNPPYSQMPFGCYFYQIESGYAANIHGIPFKSALDKFDKLKAFL